MRLTRLTRFSFGFLLMGGLLSCSEGSVVETPLQVADIAIAGSRASLLVGESMQLQATPRSASGKLLTARAVTWSSSNTAVATVNGAGAVQAVGAGTASVTASSGTASAVVTFAVVAPPRLQLSHSTVAFAGTAGGADPAPMDVSVTNGAGAAPITGVSVAVSSNAPWLTAVPTPAGTSTPLTVRINARVAGLASGQHTGTITIAAAAAANSPQLISVTLTLAAPNLPPDVRTIAATNVTAGSALLQGDVSSRASIAAGYTVWFEIGTSSTLVNFASTEPYLFLPGDPLCTAVNVDCRWQSRWDLRGSTTYYFRVAASNPIGTSRGEILSLTTLPAQAPTVTTDSASLIATTTFRTHGTSIPNGADHDFWMEVSISPDMAGHISSPILSDVAELGTRPFFISWTGATQNTTYYYRAVARNSAGIRYGTIRSLRTTSSSSSIIGDMPGHSSVRAVDGFAAPATPAALPVLHGRLHGGGG